MRKLAIYWNGMLAGELIEIHRNAYLFRYEEAYFNNQNLPAISIALPKTIREHHHNALFPFFCNMVAEGANLDVQEHYLNIDRNDIFRLLEATAGGDTIGAVTVKPVKTL